MVAHELMHCRGMKHRELSYNMLGGGRRDFSVSAFAWAESYSIREKPEKPKPLKQEKLAKEVRKIEANIRRWQTRIKRGQTILKKWQRLLKRKQIVLARKGEAE